MPREDSEKAKKGKGGIIAVVIGSAVIIAGLLGVIIVLLGRQTDAGGGASAGTNANANAEAAPRAEAKRNVVVNRQNAEEAVDEMMNQEYVAPGYYDAQMTTTWHFQTGDAVSEDAYVANDAGNTNDVYFDVFLAEDESTPILESPVIPRGAEFKDIALDKPLEAGTYDCVAVYHLLDDEQNSISTLRVGLTIIVGQ